MTVETPTRITLPYNAKPSKACDKTGIRPSLGHGHVIEEDGKRVLLTTDSYILVRHPVGDDVPVGPIHPRALRRIESGNHHEMGEGEVRSRTDTEEVVWRADAAMKAFDTKPAPKFDSGDRTVTVAFDASLLKRLAQALGADGQRGIVLEIPVCENNRAKPQAIRVTALDGGESEGLLMPMRKRT